MTDFTTNIDMNVRMMNEKLRVDRNFDILQRDVSVSYTHLTLPTKGIVEISVVVVSLKKRRKATKD